MWSYVNRLLQRLLRWSQLLSQIFPNPWTQAVARLHGDLHPELRLRHDAFPRINETPSFASFWTCSGFCVIHTQKANIRLNHESFVCLTNSRKIKHLNIRQSFTIEVGRRLTLSGIDH